MRFIKKKNWKFVVWQVSACARYFHVCYKGAPLLTPYHNGPTTKSFNFQKESLILGINMYVCWWRCLGPRRPCRIRNGDPGLICPYIFRCYQIKILSATPSLYYHLIIQVYTSLSFINLFSVGEGPLSENRW